MRLNAADWTQIVGANPLEQTAWQRFGGMGPPNSTIDFLFREGYESESFQLRTFKETPPLKPGDITWQDILGFAGNRSMDASSFYVRDKDYNVNKTRTGPMRLPPSSR